MNVELLASTPFPENCIYDAAKGCYSSLPSYKIGEDRTNVDGFIKGIINSGHESVLEHAYFTFSIEGISRACSHQLVRHRLASPSQQSQRYVEFGTDESKTLDYYFVTPQSILDAGEDAIEIYIDACASILQDYKDLVDILVDSGRTKEQACEDARYLLPNAAKTNITVTMNLRELRHMFAQRACKRAQWEIRELAFKMYELVAREHPTLMYKAGCSCMVGQCKEGKHSCGEPYTV